MENKVLESNLKELAQSQFFCVALSGGVDSIMLLHLMATLRGQNSNWVVRAIHVNHGLNKDADQWQQFCEARCAEFNIPLISKSIVIHDNGESVEAQAREKRYAIFKKHLKENESLLTGHHQDDQAETFLLQLMRGAGIKGLSAMSEKRKLGNGCLIRPLLGCSRDEIVVYAKENKLDWIEDDSNESLRFDRNFMRHQISPLLKERWPHYAKSIARSARHCANAQDLLEEYLKQDYEMLVTAGALDSKRLTEFSQNRQLVLLRYWIAQQGFQLPSTKQLVELYRTVIEAQGDANPRFQFGAAVVKRFREKLTILANEVETPKLDAKQIFEKLSQQGLRQDIQQDELTIRFFKGGEKIRLPGRKFRHKLKKCWQEWDVPPWQRTAIPLIYYKDELIAVLDHAIAEGFNE